jgi:hypothetical protein
MVEPVMSKPALEALALSELIILAEKNDLDVPDNLDRRYIIDDLLDAQKNDGEKPGSALPQTWNETLISAVLRHPVWLYVWWDISKADLDRIRDTPGDLVLCTRFFDDPGSPAPAESALTPLAFYARDEYIHLSPGRQAVRMELQWGNTALACSGTIPVPHRYPPFSTLLSGEPLPPLLELSGYRDLLHSHYLSHRQSFMAG